MVDNAEFERPVRTGYSAKPVIDAASRAGLVEVRVPVRRTMLQTVSTAHLHGSAEPGSHKRGLCEDHEKRMQ